MSRPLRGSFTISSSPFNSDFFTQGMKVLLDFVPNHSSDEHEWFNKSLSRDPKYDGYYVWKNASGFDGGTGEPLPPNNWAGFFGGPAWTWRPERGQFYLHQFTPGQPDLNYREENTRGWEKLFLPLLNDLPGYSLLLLSGQPLFPLLHRNPEVLGEMLDVLSFWMEQGCDGFRMDAVRGDPFITSAERGRGVKRIRPKCESRKGGCVNLVL